MLEFLRDLFEYIYIVWLLTENKSFAPEDHFLDLHTVARILIVSSLVDSIMHMSLVTRKPVFEGFRPQKKLKPACSSTQASESNEIANIETRDIILSRQRMTSVLIRLRGCICIWHKTGFLMTWLIYEPRHEKTCFSPMRTTKAQNRLRRSLIAPLLFAV